MQGLSSLEGLSTPFNQIVGLSSEQRLNGGPPNGVAGFALKLYFAGNDGFCRLGRHAKPDDIESGSIQPAKTEASAQILFGQ